ncbi:efflux RND transporter periplasmic adaptor subunit [Litorivivens sp.]|uniref:efflux RND transporter periplasmic adaptor subunit n=1 Tax=Litorivivens sp. TaxID=2020868 RepID=UPI00356B53AD
MKRTRYIVWCALAILIGFALFMGLRPQPVLIESAYARRAPMELTIDNEGHTRVKDRYLVSAPVNGFLRRITLNVGDSVTPQQVLAELEPLRSTVLDSRSRAEAEARVAAARAGLMAAQERLEASKADAEYARTEFARRKKLEQTGAVSAEQLSLSRTEMRRADAQLRSATFAVDVAKHELDGASTLLKYSASEIDSAPKELVPIISPITGAVLSLHKQSEGVVSAGTALLELGDPRALEVAVDMLSFDAIRVRAGTRVLIDRWGGEPIDAVVRLIEPVGFTKVSALGVEEQRVWVILDITSPYEYWQRLGDGYRVEARFILWQADDVLQVPNAAVFRSGGNWGLYVLDGRVARFKQVSVGERSGLHAQILTGIEPGTQVILHPDSSIEDGTRVRVRQ